MMKLRKEDFKYLALGCSFFSCGGGGTPEEGLEVLKDVKEIELVNPDELNEDSYIASPYACGDLLSDVPSNEFFKELEAVRELQEYLGVKFTALFPTEIGGYNTLVVLRIAYELGIKVIDGDGAGRSVPEIHHSIPSFKGYSALPLALVSYKNDRIIFKSSESERKVETIIRSIVSKVGNVGICDHPMKVRDAKESLLLKTLSKSYEVGKLLFEQNFEKLMERIQPVKVFEDKILSVDYKNERGFTEGKISLKKGYVVFKNENMKCIYEGKIWKFPDLIIMLDKNDLSPVLNPPESEKDIYLIILKAENEWYKYWGDEF